jgi:hypothetical protein
MAGHARMLQSSMRWRARLSPWPTPQRIYRGRTRTVTLDELIAKLTGLGADFDNNRRNDGPVDAHIVGLPASHLSFLRAVNGLTVYHGAFRLFGLNRTERTLDLATWNNQETWKFAWDDRVDPYLLFGETAWGDQYAYKKTPAGGLEQEVYFLEATMLRPQPLTSSFDEFILNEFLRNAQRPYDDLAIEAVQRYGPIARDKHWAYTPSIALGGVESIDNVTAIPAVTAMIFAGDIATALRGSRPGTSPTKVIPWTDDQQRTRLKIKFT